MASLACVQPCGSGRVAVRPRAALRTPAARHAFGAPQRQRTAAVRSVSVRAQQTGTKAGAWDGSPGDGWAAPPIRAPRRLGRPPHHRVACLCPPPAAGAVTDDTWKELVLEANPDVPVMVSGGASRTPHEGQQRQAGARGGGRGGAQERGGVWEGVREPPHTRALGSGADRGSPLPPPPPFLLRSTSGRRGAAPAA